MTKSIVRLVPIILAILLLVVFAPGCSEKAEARTLTVYLAGSLSVPMQTLKAQFEEAHPNVTVLLESGGSAAMISKSIANEEAGEAPADIIASADYFLIPARMYEGGYADWTMVFASNRLVLCHRDGAPFADDIEDGTRTWYDVLRSEDVKWGHSNPDDDPCGYRSMMAFQLAQEFYFDDAATFGNTPDPQADGLYDACIPGDEEQRGRNTEGRHVVRSKSVDLIALLQSGELDYAFEYSSVAVQHGLAYLEIGDAANLSKTGTVGDSDVTYEELYDRAVVQLRTAPDEYKPTKGTPIVYGLTITKNAENADIAEEFIKFLLSNSGKQVFEVENGQPYISPPKCDELSKLPTSLKSLAVEM